MENDSFRDLLMKCQITFLHHGRESNCSMDVWRSFHVLSIVFQELYLLDPWMNINQFFDLNQSMRILVKFP